MQEVFFYNVYVTEAIGAFVYGDKRPHWSDKVMFLHERERAEDYEEIDVDKFKKDFAQRFNEVIKNERI